MSLQKTINLFTLTLVSILFTACAIDGQYVDGKRIYEKEPITQDLINEVNQIALSIKENNLSLINARYIHPINGYYDVTKFENKNIFDALVCEDGDLLLAKPQTYMNDSGLSAQKLFKQYKEMPVVVYDDIDINIGEGNVLLVVVPEDITACRALLIILVPKTFFVCVSECDQYMKNSRAIFCHQMDFKTSSSNHLLRLKQNSKSRGLKKQLLSSKLSKPKPLLK
jgi:hypothetical protein